MVFMVFIGVIFLLLYLHNFVLFAEVCVKMKQHLILLFLLLLLLQFLFFIGLNYGTLEIKEASYLQIFFYGQLRQAAGKVSRSDQVVFILLPVSHLRELVVCDQLVRFLQ